METEDHGKQSEADSSGPEPFSCGPDRESAAQAEVEKAQAEIEQAQGEITKGVEDLKIAQRHLEEAEEEARRDKEIHFTVDGEHFETRDPVQTPNHIIEKYGDRDPATNYLVKIKGHGKDISYKDKGDIPITIENCDDFQIISIGPAPVSDGRTKVGVEAFIAGLKECGFASEVVPGKPDHVAFAYEVPTGKYAGKQVHVGVIVPPDFPASTPGGLHVSPQLHLNKGGGEHPTGGVHNSPFQGYLGLSWQYWSRPFHDWGQTKKTVAAYMGHIWKLWDTQ